MKLTEKQNFCLRELACGPTSTWWVCKLAIGEGVNKTICQYEWADAPFRQLRQKGFIKLTGRSDDMGRRIHEITDEGRKVLRGANG